MRTVEDASRASWSFSERSCWPLVSMPSDLAKAVIEPSTSTTAEPVRTASLARWISTSRGFSPNGRPSFDEFAGPGVDGRAGLDAEHRAALPAVPFADLVAGIAVGDAALALHRVEEVDPLGGFAADGDGGVEQLLLLAGEDEVLGPLGSCAAQSR